MPRNLLRILPGLVLFTAALLAKSTSAADKVDFQREVRPILSKYCFKCHGPDDNAREAGLRLDEREGALAEADSGEKAIVPQRPEMSELVRRILSDDESTRMPPPETKLALNDQQKDVLRRWIAEGAEYQPHWAFVAPQRPALPSVEAHDWPRTGLDYFVLARLEREGLSPAKEADRRTLVRRVYLDLIGIPPTPEAAEAFVNDPAPDAYERLVDRLLASPLYGERWARKWLDLARYADTNGYEKDRVRSIWPYRDWVIGALNRGMPFDQFTIEQLAGDMLPGATPAQRIATGFHRNTMLNEEGGIDPLEFRYYATVDRINTTATTWLGLTMACAQCHTHKYDPIPHREYYSMMAFLNNADEPEIAVPEPAIAARRAEMETRIRQLEAQLADRFPGEETLTFHPVSIDKATSAGGAKLELRDDKQIVFASGEMPERDTYTLEFTTDAMHITALQIEALTDEKLPSTGPGRTAHGNFVLSEIKLELVVGEGKSPQPIKFVAGTADFAQENFPAAHAIDGKDNTGWAIHGPGKWNQNRQATFTFDKPIENASGARWKVTLSQNYGQQHTLGKLRLQLGAANSTSDKPLAVQREEHRTRKFAAWQAEAQKTAVRWTALTPSRAHADTPLLTIEEDGSVFASGDQTKRDVYELAFATKLPKLTAIRIEALPDERLPKNGPGRIYYEGPHGDFFLSEVTLRANGQPRSFAKAVHSFAAGGNTAGTAIDGNQQTGWSINGRQGEAHSAVFVLAEPVENVQSLELDLLFERYYAAGLGRFRIWATDDLRAAESTALPADIEAILTTDPNQLTMDAEQRLLQHFLNIAPELAAARAEIDQLRKQLPQYPTTLVLSERPERNPRATFRMHRGEFLQPKEEVEPGVLSVLHPLPVGAPKNRLTFAKWLLDPQNPLTARVVVNRNWGAFFGRGLVRTTEDFGFQGESPSHPDLLNYLAVEFRDSSWSVKDLHRQIVTSSTYRQSSAAPPELFARDPGNELLARGPRVRLEAEQIRDSALAISGLLSRKQGGPSVFPPQPPGVTTEGAYGALAWNVSQGEARYRRGLYTFTKRTAPYAMNLTFDGSSGEVCIPRRDVSNTPLQALVLLNDEVFLEAAQALGREFAGRAGSDDERLAALFNRALVRQPDSQEADLLRQFLLAQRERLAKKELDAVAIAGPGGNAPERAAWTLVARGLLNLDQTITKE
jgi:hypothetical protein